MSFVGGCSRHQARRLLMWGLTQPTGTGGAVHSACPLLQPPTVLKDLNF